MNAKKARAIRKLINLDLSDSSVHKDRAKAKVGSRLIGIIHHDGTFGEREENVAHYRTTEERYLYRELKKVYKTGNPPTIKTQLIEDLNAAKSALEKK